MLSLLLHDRWRRSSAATDMRLRQGFFERAQNYAGNPRDLTAFVRQNPH